MIYRSVVKSCKHKSAYSDYYQFLFGLINKTNSDKLDLFILTTPSMKYEKTTSKVLISQPNPKKLDANTIQD